MTDIPTVAAAFTGIRSALEIVKALRQADLALGEAEAKARLAEAVSALADAQMQILDTRSLITEKDTEIARLREALANKAKVVKDGEAYWETDADGRPAGDPYCVRCLEVDHRLVHVNQNPARRSSSICPQCKNSYDWQRRRL